MRQEVKALLDDSNCMSCSTWCQNLTCTAENNLSIAASVTNGTTAGVSFLKSYGADLQCIRKYTAQQGLGFLAYNPTNIHTFVTIDYVASAIKRKTLLPDNSYRCFAASAQCALPGAISGWGDRMAALCQVSGKTKVCDLD